MAIVIKVAEWRAEGLRCPDHHVSFLKDGKDIFPVSLIQMPNGTGKTTTLELLRAALSGDALTGKGSAQEWSADKIRSFQKRNSQSSSGLFQVILICNTRRLTITMDFDFDDGNVRYSTTLPSSGNREGFHPPRDVMKFFEANFVNFFVFDGELAAQLLDQEHTKAQDVIKDLFQLSLFSDLTDRIEGYWKEKTEQVGVTQQKGLTRRRNKVNNLRGLLKQRKKMQELTNTEYIKKKEELKRKKERFEEALTEREEVKDQLHQADIKLKEAQSQVDSSVNDVLEDMRNPHSLSSSFASRMITLKDSLDRVKLPESAAREFFEELADEAECVCGRPINDDIIRAHIKERAKRYMGSDDVSILNRLKEEVADLVGTETDSHEVKLKQKISALDEARRQEENSKTARDAIKNKAVAEDPELEKVEEEINKLEDTLQKFEDFLKRFEAPDNTSRKDEDTWGIQALEHRLKDAEHQLAKATNTLELKAKGDLLAKIINKAHYKAKEEISVELCQEANKRIEGLMPANAIRIQKITQSLVLQGQEAGSVGETLSIGYAFLATLFNGTDHKLPFIVDSPANPIDLEVRANVAQLVPKLSHQFIAFTISSERDGFLPSLETASADNDIQYITMFRKDMQSDNDLNGEHAKESIDGWCVHGKTYFQRFQLDEEDPVNAV